MKMHQKKSHVIEVIDEFDILGNGVGTEDSDYYFRNYNGRVLIGATDCKTGKDCEGFDRINRLIIAKYNVRKIQNRWINIDAMSLDGMPYIGQYTGFDENMYVATGFNMWGMTKSMLGAHIICDLINGKENKYADLFSPQRRMLIKPLLSNVGSAIKGMFTFGEKRCKHLGCCLHYNKTDRTYECPCHGSKYDRDGSIVETPSQKPINAK